MNIYSYVTFKSSGYLKILLMIKLTFVLLITAFLQMSSAASYSQTITLRFNNAKLETVLKEIRAQAGVDLIYTVPDINEASPVNIKVSRVSLIQALEKCFTNQSLTYTISNNIVIVKRKPDLFVPKILIEFEPEVIEADPPITISGVVKDSEGITLPSVSVKVKGTTQGTTTDMNGQYTITIPDNSSILVFTYIGYITQEVPINNRTTITVVLEVANAALNEVVVTALGVTKSKRGLGYSVQEVRGDEFTEARQNNIASALTGKIAGVDATQVNSGSGASSRVIIRGNTSLNGNQQPLYVVDGMPINNTNRSAAPSSGGLNVDRGDGISSMNPDDIATISVLKGGAAAALYGSQAANGVILITTKKGTVQKGVGIEVTSDSNFGMPAVFPNFQYEYGQGTAGQKPVTLAQAIATGRLSFGAKMDGSLVMQADGVMRPYSPFFAKDNIRNFFRTSQNITNTVAFSAGNQNLRMRLSVSDLRSKDQQPNSEFMRKTANLNVTGKMGKNDFITIESSVQYNLVNGINRPNVGYAELNAAWGVYMVANSVDIRNMIGDPANPGIDPITGREQRWNSSLASVNPYYAAYQLGNQDDLNRLIGRASVQVNFLPNLYFKGTVAKDYNDYSESNYIPNTNEYFQLGYFDSQTSKADKTNFQGIVNYNQRFLTDKLGVNILVGSQSERDFGRSQNANGTQWIVPDFYNLSNLVNRDLVNLNESKIGTNSLFGEANIDYKNFFYLTVTGRKDWFSVLNPGFNSIFYPSVGLSFILSDVVKLPKLFNYAKLRSSWAEVGSATVNAGSINQTYSINTLNAYSIPGLSNPNILQNPNIRPVAVTTIEGGFEVQILDSRIGLDVNYYSRSTRDDILTPPISQFTGYSAGRQNLGLVTNKGWEISLSGTPVRKNDFSWDVSYNFSYNQSKIVELAEGINFLSLGSGTGGVSMINAVGLPFSTLRANVFQKDPNGIQIFNKTSGLQVVGFKDVGVGNPPYLMGLSNNFRFKRFSLALDIDSKFGAVGWSNMMQYAARFGKTMSTLPGRENGLTVSGVDISGAPFTKLWPVSTLQTYYNSYGSNNREEFIYKTDFIKLRRVVLKYNLPANSLKFMKIQSASFGLTGFNLAILYRDKRIKEAGIDPEMQESVTNAQGSQGISMPRTRNIGLNLNLKF